MTGIDTPFTFYIYEVLQCIIDYDTVILLILKGFCFHLFFCIPLFLVGVVVTTGRQVQSRLPRCKFLLFLGDPEKFPSQMWGIISLVGPGSVLASLYSGPCLIELCQKLTSGRPFKNLSHWRHNNKHHTVYIKADSSSGSASVTTFHFNHIQLKLRLDISPCIIKVSTQPGSCTYINCIYYSLSLTIAVVIPHQECNTFFLCN